MLIIVGRKRVLPLDVLPPMRTETILQLAAIKNPDLGQSYERNYVFAGRYNERDDWAPIYLSDELIDTEYGSLLNITDQILKRWSMAGTINYVNFEKYKDPDKFVFGNETLMDQLNAKEITFNWNTFGAGYSTETNGYRIFALNRTGALPTSYLNKESENYFDAEEKGYDYFAKVGDSNLTKVVQYASLYQIFQDSKVNAGKDAFTFAKFSPDYQELYLELRKVIDKIKNLNQNEAIALSVSSEDMLEMAKAIGIIKRFKTESEIKAAAASILEPRNLNNQFNKKVDAYKRKYKSLVNSSNSITNKIASNIIRYNELDNQESILVKLYNSTCLSIPFTPQCVAWKREKDNAVIQARALVKETRNLESKKISTENEISNLGNTFGVFIEFNDALRKISKNFISVSESNRLKDIYLNSLPIRKSNWIRTPSIVVSTNDDIRSVGGHNLDSTITVFKQGNVPSGKVRIVEQGGKRTIFTNPVDINKVSGLVRIAGANNRNIDAQDFRRNVEQKLSSQPIVQPKTKEESLEYPNRNMILPVSATEKTGWLPNKKVQPFEDDIITITKLADGSESIIYGNKEVMAYSPTSRNDYLTNIKYGGKDPARIRMIGYEVKDANSLRESMSVRSVGLVKNFKGSGKRLAGEFDFANAKINEPNFEIIGKGSQTQTRVTIDVEIPLATNKPGLYLKIEKFFKGAISKVRQQQIVQRFKTLFQEKFGSFQATPEREINLIATEVQNEIRKEFPDVTNVKVFLYEDLTVSKNLRIELENDTNAE